jgi:hypothetical protein
MFPFLRLGRRKFLRDCAVGLAAAPLVSRASEFSGEMGVEPQTTANSLPAKPVAHSNKSVWILRGKDADFAEVLAWRELVRGLRNLGFARESVQAVAGEGEVPSTATVFFLSTDAQRFKGPEGYEIIQEEAGDKPARVRIVGAKSQAVLYAVFDFLERQGALFGLDGEVYPLDAPASLQLPGAGRSWLAQPRFPVRGLLPWPDFLNCVTVYNREDWRAYLEAMVRMRFNTLGVHVYTSEEQWVEPFLSFAYCGVGHQAFLDTTATNRWGYLPQRTSQYGMGSADFLAGEVFGADSAINARNCWEAQENAQKVWREAFSYAKQLGIRTGVGFEPYRIPDEILRAAPPEAMYLPAAGPADPALSPRIGPRIDPESVAARDILETRLARLLEAYPSVDYVWLWEDEQMNWASQKGTIPISVTPFRQAYDFLKRHAPEKRLVISGWGGVVRHFAYLHAQLPEDIVFSSLNDNVGWDAVHEAFGKLENRERWAIPWLENDPAMWLPQFHVHRIQRDMDLAEQYGWIASG